MIYVITYDRPLGLLRNNSTFLDEMRSLGPYWVNPMERMWLVYSDLTAQRIGERLLKYMTGPNDKLFVIRLTRDYHGYLPSEAWEWIDHIRRRFPSTL